MRIKLCVLLALTLLLTFKGAQFAAAWTPKPVSSDPLVRMPGTQPDQGVNLEAPNRCLNCHAGYNEGVEPGFNWKGSMMAQAARDPIFWACLTVAAQDSIWALGNPNAVDICERCHFPEGWLGGRSDPPNASAMTGSDFDGLHCDFCHTKWDPFSETTYDGTREGNDWTGYWDEATSLSQTEAVKTYSEDMLLAQAIRLFSGGNFFVRNISNLLLPKYSTYTEDGSGQYFISTGSQKRASFADAAARHQMLYSRHHKSKYFCGTCHDVSNPALANLGLSGLPTQIDPVTGQPSSDLITEQYSASKYFHVERTFSEFMLSAYGQQGGAATNAGFQAQGAPDIAHAAKCQDCHMRDVVGVACNKQGVPVRPDGSVEHPNSGQPLHDLTGGNAWISHILASLDPNVPVYDPVNVSLLDQGPVALTLDLNQGQTPKVNGAALLAGADRAKQQLLLAATITNLAGDRDTVDYNPTTGELSFRIQNNSAHKLISGFPEGRRMFINIKAYDVNEALIYEVNPYDHDVGTLKGLPASPLLLPNEVYVSELVYEVHPKSSLTEESETFHFVLADGRSKDNRIPPKGFDIGPGNTYQNMKDRLSEPVRPSTHQPDVNYFTDAEYIGGYDQVSNDPADVDHFIDLGNFPANAASVVVSLYYQGTSREYIEFLRDEILGETQLIPNLTLPDPDINTPVNEAYIVQTDPFFAQLKAWGNVIWDLWFHNHGLDNSGVQVDCIVPFMMTQAIFSDVSTPPPPPPCSAPIPVLSPVQQGPGNLELTVTWSDEHTADPNVTGYNIYYDQAGKAQLVASVGLQTTYTDTGLTKEIQYCYKVTSLYAGCESDFSNVECAIAKALPAGVNQLVTGVYIGKGKTATFTPQSIFKAGDSIVIRAYVVDKSTGLPLSNASVNISVDGLSLSPTNASDASGIAETTWNTSAPDKRGQVGTPPDTYTATVTNVTASGYSWDMGRKTVSFEVQ